MNGFKAGLDVLVGRAKEFGRGRPDARPPWWDWIRELYDFGVIVLVGG